VITFDMDRHSEAGGPGIFSVRLFDALINNGCRYEIDKPANKLSIIAGYYKYGTYNKLKVYKI